ncbi:MAG: DUF937 domain-containing protein [Hyphomonadaceae bacterium]|jgi:hypothetical protein|nr:DUF937 domain-containing protein [Hyphomonadaceae bacterium]
MQMRDAIEQVQAGSLTDRLAEAFAVTPAQADAVMRWVASDFAWYLQKNTLSRGGLADLVEALGSGHHAAYLSHSDVFRDEAVGADGNAILGALLGSKDASRMLAARAARRCGLTTAQVAAMLPYLAGTMMGSLARRAQLSLGNILAQVPPLGTLGSGNAYVDLAGILRRRCGAGAYSPRALPRAVRRAISRAAGFYNHGVLVWYARFMVGRAGTRWLRAVLTPRRTHLAEPTKTH